MYMNPFLDKIDKQVTDLSLFIKETSRFFGESADLFQKIESNIPASASEDNSKKHNILAFIDYGFGVDANYTRVDIKEYMKTLQTQIYNLYENEDIDITVHLAIHTHNRKCRPSKVKHYTHYLTQDKHCHTKRNRHCRSESSCDEEDDCDLYDVKSECGSDNFCLDDKTAYDKISICVKFVDYNNYNVQNRTTGKFDSYYVGPSTCRSYVYLQTMLVNFSRKDSSTFDAIQRIISINQVSNIIVKDMNTYGKGLDLVARYIISQDLKDDTGLNIIDSNDALALVVYFNLILRS